MYFDLTNSTKSTDHRLNKNLKKLLQNSSIMRFYLQLGKYKLFIGQTGLRWD